MKTNRKITLFCIVFLVLFIAGQAFADIVIYKSGSHIECTLVDVDDKHVTIKTEYGEQKIPRRELFGWYQKELGKPGSDFFRAGELLAGRGMRNKAIKLFERAIALDPAYRQPAERVLAGMPSTGVDSTATGGRMVVVTGPKMVSKVLVCPICAGEGELLKERETEVTTIKNKVPCWFCDGKGIGILRYPEGTRICPNCNGWGHIRGEFIHGTSDSDNADKKKMGDEKDNLDFRHPCWQCRGVGYIGRPKAIDTAMEHIDSYTVSEEGSTGHTNQASGQTSHPGPDRGSDPSMSSSTSDDDDEIDDEDEEEEEEEEDSWFKKNKILVLLIGGGALLIVVLVMSQSSKK